MRVLIVELVYFLLIVSAFNIRTKRHLPDDPLSHEYMQKLMVDLGHELKQFDEELSDDDPHEIVPTVSTTTLSAEHLAGDLTLRLYPQAMKYIAEVRNHSQR
ncbi:unnamed protein product [Nippostrongylus brasiliensis]|uniref:Pigment dispersing hormone n=1 Tax=Nippostrongylus brasiliensis TaxID=27835 RepID=A0A0N4XPA7_NIPBR|nr:unnamed protein product [Nippostrongylus brasiliensis]